MRFLALAVVAACSQGPGSGSSRSGRQCVADVGCPETAPLPACTADQIAGAVPAQTAVRAHVQGGATADVTVRGTLAKANTVCTLLDCGGATCCNGCGGFLALSMGSATGYADNAHKLLLMGEGIECSGDDSGICCTHPPDSRVIARIAIKVHGSYKTALYGPSYRGNAAEIICSVPPDAGLEEPPPLRVAIPVIRCDEPAPATGDVAAALRGASPEQLGDFRRNELGCVGNSILERGPAAAPALLGLLDDPSVGEAAAFLLSQVCQVPRYMPGRASDRQRFLQSVAKHCPKP